MFEILIKAFSFLLIIAVGYALKRVHFFAETDYHLITKIVLNLTLPCAVITSFAAGFQRDASLYLITALGALSNLIMFFVGNLLARRQDKNCRYLYGLTIHSYSIGTFIIPFAQGFVGPSGVVVACMFDIGSALISSGFTYSILSGRLEGGGSKGAAVRNTLKKLSHSTLFLTYCALLLISVIGLNVPSPVLQFTGIVGSANSFMSFLMIGAMFEISANRRHLTQVSTVIAARLIGAFAFSLIAWKLLPFSAEARYVLAMIAFAPISATAVALTEQATHDGKLPSLACSITILIAIAASTLLVLFSPVGTV